MIQIVSLIFFVFESSIHFYHGPLRPSQQEFHGFAVFEAQVLSGSIYFCPCAVPERTIFQLCTELLSLFLSYFFRSALITSR